MKNPPTAAIAATDRIALGMLKEASNIGIDIPGRLSVAGFDATITGQYHTPSLYSVRQPLLTMGYTAAKELIKIIDGSEDLVEDHIFPVTLIPGNSISPVI
jgi:LacI family transcriptional regulator